ncbi:hypothetical protein [Streptomyces sp. NPDC127114]|uniref:hypothetical protein n=1 Tax=Streptomyces sp. NPDC127114 TaxID=3345366 RepID=UPI0036361673
MRPTGPVPFGKTIARYGRLDLLRIHEPGCMSLDRRGARRAAGEGLSPEWWKRQMTPGPGARDSPERGS